METKKCSTETCPKEGRWRSDYCPQCRAYHKRAAYNGAEWCLMRQTLLTRWDERLQFILSKARSLKRGRLG